MKSTITEKFFYHIYPLGMYGAPAQNDFSSPAGNGLLKLMDEIPRLRALGVSALYLGPLFESTAHGYDTLDYYHVDRRLGTNTDLTRLVKAMHKGGIAVVLDGVFNHVGRHFFAFKDLQEYGSASRYRDWFVDVDFSRRGPAGDSFSYAGWSGHYDLVKLDVGNPQVREHLFGAVKFWMEEFGIDGIRLDAADVLAPDFMDALADFCALRKPDFWLLGEVVHGDYNDWARQGRLESVTNYEVYKGLWSSLNDANFFELAWSLNRQSGKDGIYKSLSLYNFVDNHDVNRVASVLRKQSHLFPLYGLLFTIPGIPSVYYGSERGLRGEKKKGSDAELRPEITAIPPACTPSVDSDALESSIRLFAEIRKAHPALQHGTYSQIHVSAEQFVFSRETEKERILVAVNSGGDSCVLTVPCEDSGGSKRFWSDILNPGGDFPENRGTISLDIPSSWLRILVRSEETWKQAK